MLLPYKKEPATGSLIPSMSTGGAAMKATMKHAAAASKHGIMSTPNQPTYNLFSVDVTHSQNCGQPASRLDCLRVIFEVVISKTFVSRASKVLKRNLFPKILHFRIKRRSIILPLKVSVKAVCSQGDDYFGSFLMCWFPN